MRDSSRRRRVRSCGGLATAVAVATLLALAATAAAQPDVSYKRRGDHYYEGLRDRLPVAGEDIALLAAQVHPREPASAWPSRLRLTFYLPEADGEHLAAAADSEAPAVFLTVRQLHPGSTFYWLDRVGPTSRWHSGTVNAFSWPTSEVLESLPPASLEDLAVVVRLEQEHPRIEERVAPTALFHTVAPAFVSAYRFTFKLSGNAHLSGRLLRRDAEVFSWPLSQETVGNLVTLHWDSTGEPEGWYVLLVEGTFDLHRDELYKKVVFYHRPALPPATLVASD